MTSASRFELSDRTYQYATWAVVAMAAILRFWDLGGPSFWFDEAVYAINSRGGLGDVIHETQANNSSPLLLPLILHLLERTVGLNEFTARLPSALFGIAAVWIMTRLKDVGVARWVALTAAALLAVSQMQIIYSQEVREYGLSILMSAVLLWSFFTALQTGKVRALCIAVAITPWASYGPCFAVLAVLVTLVFLRMIRRTELPYVKIAIAFAIFLGSAVLSYFAVAQFQLGTATQWYLLEHYFGASGMNIVEWLATNSGGILLASLPGLLAVLLMPVVMLVYLARFLKRPLDLFAQPGLIVAVVLIGGMIMAGILELYPYGSPRHSVFVGPFICLMFAIGLNGVISNLKPGIQFPASAVLGGVIGVSALLTIFAIPLGAGLHPALAKVGKVEIYGEYEDNRALIDYARQRADLTLYGAPGASPGVLYYGADLDIHVGSRDLIGDYEALAGDILPRAENGPVVVIMANMIEGEGDELRKVLKARGALIEDPFTAKRVEGFVVRTGPAAP